MSGATYLVRVRLTLPDDRPDSVEEDPPTLAEIEAGIRLEVSKLAPTFDVSARAERVDE